MMIVTRLARILLMAAASWEMLAPSLLGESGKQRQPVPSDAAQAAALKIVKEIYGAGYAKADTLAAKQELAKKLLEQAKGTKDDLPGQFVLLKLARDIATQGLDGLTAFQAVDLLAETFEIDPVEMKAAVLNHGAAHAKLAVDHEHLMDAAWMLVDAAVTEDNYAVARQLCELTAAEAEAAKRTSMRDLATTRAAEVENVLAVLYDKAQNASGRLKADAIDAEANTAVGKYLCFVKGDWEKGLLMLALGNDANLRELAQSELSELSSRPPEQLGDDWWDRSEKESGFMKCRAQARAAYWYRQALPRLTGLAKVRVQKRVDSLAEQPATTVAQKPVEKKVAFEEHKTWTVPYTWVEQVQRTKTVIEFSPGTGHQERQIPYMETVHRHATKTVQAVLVRYDYKAGDVVLKITIEKEGGRNGEKEEGIRRFRYSVLGKDDKKFLDSVKKQLMEQEQ
jgi:hypothetical protein